VPIEPKSLTNQPFPAISGDRAANFPGNGHAQPRPLRAVRVYIDNQRRVGRGTAELVDFVKFRRFSQVERFGEMEMGHDSHNISNPPR